MMTQSEVIDLLSAISAYDNRNASQAAVLAWREASGRGRWTFPEALDAVHGHYTESTVFIMPGHVTERIRAVRQDIAMRESVEASPDLAGQRRVAELIKGVFPPVCGDREDFLGEVLSERCPSCGAEPGQPCTRETPAGRVAAWFPHLPRMRPHRDAS